MGPEAWSTFLTEAVGMPVEVTFGRARRQVLVAKPKGSGWSLRLNAGFGQAPPEVRAAVAAWMANGRRARRASAVLDAWIQDLGQRLSQEPRPMPPLRPRGRAHDLGVLFGRVLAHDLSEAELARLSPPALTWGRMTRRARRSLQLGSYDADLNLIRIHPVLDQEAVPDWFVRFVLFHEVLHALYPPSRGRGSRVLHHPPEHVNRERQHPDWNRAEAWQRDRIGALLCSVRSGRPLGRPRARRGPIEAIQRLLFD